MTPLEAEQRVLTAMGQTSTIGALRQLVEDLKEWLEEAEADGSPCNQCMIEDALRRVGPPYYTE